MTPSTRRRKAIATIVGTLFMALVFLIAIGAQVYLSDLQGSTVAAQSQAQQRAVLKGHELFSFGGAPGSLEVTNSGGQTTTVVAMLLKLENGTVYHLNASSTPRFRPTELPSGGGAMVQLLVPNGACRPRNWTCASVYQAIIGDTIPGRGVGLVTSLGNTFWYVPSATTSGAQDSSVLRTRNVESTSATEYTGIPGLWFSGAAASFYVVQIQIGYWQSGPLPNSDMFAIAVSNGTTFMFCGGMDWSTPTGSGEGPLQGTSCSSDSGQSLGPTWSPAVYCNFRQFACEFVGVAYVSFGPAGGTFTMEFEGTASGDANVLADSVLMVTSR